MCTRLSYSFKICGFYPQCTTYLRVPTAEARSRFYSVDALLMVLLARVRSVFRKAWTPVNYIESVFFQPALYRSQS